MVELVDTLDSKSCERKFVTVQVRPAAPLFMLIYSFRTFPELKKLQGTVGNFFTFGSLISDLKKFEAIIEATKPQYILGIAGTDKQSRLEPLAINQFGKDKKVIKDGPGQVELATPDIEGFVVSTKPTSSFCNWTMYQLQRYIDSKQLNTKLVFMHLNPKDIPKLQSLDLR